MGKREWKMVQFRTYWTVYWMKILMLIVSRNTDSKKHARCLWSKIVCTCVMCVRIACWSIFFFRKRFYNMSIAFMRTEVSYTYILYIEVYILLSIIHAVICPQTLQRDIISIFMWTWVRARSCFVRFILSILIGHSHMITISS